MISKEGPSVALIITTYNWPEALEAVIRSVKQQSLPLNQIIIADDGSTNETRILAEKMAIELSLPIEHSWQKDSGFRAAMSRNRAIAKVKSEYTIIIDGDIVLPPNFIAEHLAFAKRGSFIQGGRVILSKDLTSQLICTQQPPKFFAQGLRNRKNLISNKWLSKVFTTVRNNDRSTRSCNMSFWTEDLITVNGFDNRFVGWGREDSELVLRLLNFGLNRLYLKFAGAGLHLYHAENSRESLPKNELILQNTIKEKCIRCEDGVSKFKDTPS